MTSYFKLLRLFVLPACVGTFLAALMMFVLAATKLYSAARAILTDGAVQAGSVTSAVMGATDALLFGVVLIVFSAAVADGFLFTRDKASQTGGPEWIRFHGVGKLKQTLLEVIIVFLVVDVATDLAGVDDAPGWTTLVKPLAIVLLAVSIRLMSFAWREES